MGQKGSESVLVSAVASMMYDAAVEVKGLSQFGVAYRARTGGNSASQPASQPFSKSISHPAIQ